MTKISYFNNVFDNVPKEYDLDKWLVETMHPPANLEEEVKRYRDTFDKKLKEKLPCVTISASFKGERNLDNIDVKNHFIVLDIDRTAKGKNAKLKKCNICVNMQLVKELFAEHPCTYYVGFSVSGDGVYAILRLEDPDCLDDYFAEFRASFSRIGINIDEACKDYTRLRFFSVDKEAFYNPHAIPYRKPAKQEPAPQRSLPVQKPSPVNNEPDEFPERFRHLNNQQKVEALIAVITYHKMDITSNYQDWFKIGAGLYNEFGEAGRDYFLQISQHHPEYSFKECDKKFTQCKTANKIKLSSLFWIATGYGLRY